MFKRLATDQVAAPSAPQMPAGNTPHSVAQEVFALLKTSKKLKCFGATPKGAVLVGPVGSNKPTFSVTVAKA